jgi:hypothetical protein
MKNETNKIKFLDYINTTEHRSKQRKRGWRISKRGWPISKIDNGRDSADEKALL